MPCTLKVTAINSLEFRNFTWTHLKMCIFSHQSSLNSTDPFNTNKKPFPEPYLNMPGKMAWKGPDKNISTTSWFNSLRDTASRSWRSWWSREGRPGRETLTHLCAETDVGTMSAVGQILSHTRHREKAGRWISKRATHFLPRGLSFLFLGQKNKAAWGINKATRTHFSLVNIQDLSKDFLLKNVAGKLQVLISPSNLWSSRSAPVSKKAILESCGGTWIPILVKSPVVSLLPH